MKRTTQMAVGLGLAVILSAGAMRAAAAPGPRPAPSGEEQQTVRERQATAWLRDAKARLAIRGDQEAQWRAFADAYVAMAKQYEARQALMQSMMATGQGRQLDREGHAQMRNAMHGMMAESQERLESARRDLVGVLDAEQHRRASGLLH